METDLEPGLKAGPPRLAKGGDGGLLAGPLAEMGWGGGHGEQVGEEF
jgi:hypothetical protein